MSLRDVERVDGHVCAAAAQERRVSLRDVVWYNMTNRLLSSDHVLLWHLEAVIEISRERSCFALSCDEEENMRAKHGGEEGGSCELAAHTVTHIPFSVASIPRPSHASVCVHTTRPGHGQRMQTKWPRNDCRLTTR